jgi:hypothetical protein
MTGRFFLLSLVPGTVLGHLTFVTQSTDRRVAAVVTKAEEYRLKAKECEEPNCVRSYARRRMRIGPSRLTSNGRWRRLDAACRR